MQALGLPSSTASRVLQLAAETGARASELHVDTTIAAERKHAALQQLQERVRPACDALVPASLRATLPEQARAWFTMLGEGRYMGFMPSIDSTGSGISVTTKPPRRSMPRPPRVNVGR